LRFKTHTIVAAMLLSGCQSARVETPVTATLGGNDPDQQIEFWHTLAEQPVTSNDDAFHGLLLYIDGNDPATDYPGRVAALRSKKLLPDDFKGEATDAIQRGTLAVAIVQALHIKGGWAMHAFGPTPRYATRELQFLELYPLSSPTQTFTGSEFLGIMGKFEDEQRAMGPAVTDVTEPEAPGQFEPPMPAPDLSPSKN
jgi:hypothetical protein